MPTDTTVSNLIINKLTKAQYDAITTKSDTELYLVPDTIDTTPTSGSDNCVTSGGVYTALESKEDKVSVGTISGTSLSASIGTYYVGSNVGTLTVTLPTVSDSTHVANVVLNIATGSSAAVTFTAASGISILYSKDFAIESSMEYEVNCLWQGTKWLITAVEFESQS